MKQPNSRRGRGKKRVQDPGKKVVGFGWVGVWNTDSPHRLGFLMPNFIVHKHGEVLSLKQRDSLAEKPQGCAASDMYRVRITIEPVKDRRGRYIVRRTKGPK